MTARGRLAERVKGILDRRYVRVDDLVDLQKKVEQCTLALAELQAAMERIAPGSTPGPDPGTAFVSGEDPHELRKRLYSAHRLANECAQSMERAAKTPCPLVVHAMREHASVGRGDAPRASAAVRAVRDVFIREGLVS